MILVIMMNCCFAAALPLLKAALQYVDPFILVTVRMLGGGLLLCGTQLIKKHTISMRTINWKLVAINAFLSMFLLCTLEAWALQGISATKANLMWATLPLLTALVVRLWQGTSLHYKHVIAISLGMLGILFLMGQGDTLDWSLVFPSNSWHYDIVMLLAVGAAACGYICIEQLTTQNHPVLITNGLSMLGGGLCSLASTYYMHKTQSFYTANWSSAWIYIISVIIIVNIVGLSLQMWLTKHHSVTLLALSSFITPLCGALYGVIQGDIWNYSLLCAALCIGSGLYIFHHNDIKRITHGTS